MGKRNENIKGMDEKLDKLPERIAKELKDLLGKK